MQDRLAYHKNRINFAFVSESKPSVETFFHTPQGPLSTSITIIDFDEARFQEKEVETIEECFSIKIMSLPYLVDIPKSSLLSLFHQLDIFWNNKLEKTLLKLLLWNQLFKPEASYAAQLIVDVHPLDIITAG